MSINLGLEQYGALIRYQPPEQPEPKPEEPIKNKPVEAHDSN